MTRIAARPIARLGRAGLALLVAAAIAGGEAVAGERLAPGHPLDRVVVERLLVPSLLGGAGAGEIEIRIDAPDLPLPNHASQPIDVSLRSLSHDEASGRFSAELAATLPSGAGSRIHVAGSVVELADVPVLTRGIAAGETVGAADIRWTRMALPRRQRDALLDAADILGLEARRPLPAGRPLRARDLRAPLLVQRGEAVSAVFATGGLEITAAAVALGVGRRGEVIEVKNPSSGEVRRGVVEGRQRVRVGGLAGVP